MRGIACILLFIIACQTCSSQEIHVLLAFDSDRIRVTDQSKLDELVAAHHNNTVRYLVRGYTDASGTGNYNLNLSKRRALQVKKYLMDRQVRPDQLQVEYYGEWGAHSADDRFNRKVSVVVIPVNEKISSYPELRSRLAPLAENFSILADQPVRIECAKGSVLTIPADAFCDSLGNTIKGPVQIGVTEYMSVADLISKNLTTLAGGNMLISSAVLDIKASSSNREVFLRSGKEITIDVPRTQPEKAYTFYGKPLEDGTVDWELDDSLFRRSQRAIAVTLSEDGTRLIVVDSITAARRHEKGLIYDRTLKKVRQVNELDRLEMEYRADSLQKISENLQQDFRNMERYYSTLNTRQLGLINIDIFFTPAEIITYYTKVENPGMQVFDAYLVFDNARSVARLNRGDNGEFYIYARLPVNRPARLLVSGTLNGQFYSEFKKVVIADKKREIITLSPSTLEDFSVLLKRL